MALPAEVVQFHPCPPARPVQTPWPRRTCSAPGVGPPRSARAPRPRTTRSTARRPEPQPARRRAVAFAR